MSASIVERIWGPNLIRQALDSRVSPPVQHIKRIRHQLSELLLEAVGNNDMARMQYATAELDRFASAGAPVTDPLVRSMAYIAPVLGWNFPSQYARFHNDHSRKDSYFLTVLEHASYLPSLDMFDQLSAIRHQFNFNCDPPSPLTVLEHHWAFKISNALCARNEGQRLIACTQLFEWFQHHCEHTSQFVQDIMCVSATYGASEVFALSLEVWRNSLNEEVLARNCSTVETVCNTCVAYDQMALFERVFETFPSHRNRMFSMWDYADKAGNSNKNLDAVLPYVEHLTTEQLQYLTSDAYATNTTRRAAIAEHAQHLLQRATLLRDLPSVTLSQRRKV